MNRLDKFKDYVKTAPIETDQVMAEVYRGLTAAQTGFSMFDGGAHKGWHTSQMMRLAGCTTVWSVEADPTMSAVLAENLARWHSGPGPELRILLKALQDDPNLVSIPWMSSHSHVGRSSIRAANATQPTIWAQHKDVQYRDETSVPATTIDLILAGDPNALPFLKLDLEGADILALRGAEKTLADKRPVIAYENSDKAPSVHGYSLDDVLAYFSRLEYVVLDYVGVPMQKDSWFQFYEAWAVPMERLAETTGLINQALDRRI